MSPMACIGSSERAGHLGPASPRSVGHIHLVDAPVGPVGLQHHLKGPSRPAVRQSQSEQPGSPGRSHRSEVAERQARAPAHLRHEHPVGEPRVQRPRPATRPAGAQHEVQRAAGHHRAAHRGEITRIERSVGVHEAHHVALGGLQAGPARGSETAHGLGDRSGTVRLGHHCRSISRPVVDHQRRVAGRHPAEDPRQRLHLVEDGHDHVRHARHGSEGNRWCRLERLTKI